MMEIYRTRIDTIRNYNLDPNEVIKGLNGYYESDKRNGYIKATGKLMVEDYEFKLKNYILKDIKKHGYRYDSLETKSIEEIVDRIIQIATCPRNEWANCEIENLRGQISRLKDLINVMNKEVGDM